MPPELQLEQLVTYIEATYDPDAAQYLALLPDRITHAAMLMLGSAVDHAMPAVAYARDVTVEKADLGEIFVPSSPTGAWGISLYDGPRNPHHHAWRPDVAAVAELSGVTILDVDDASHAGAALAYARERTAGACSVWAFGAAGAAVPPGADAYALTFPTDVSAATLDTIGGAPALFQVASRDEIATPLPAHLPANVTRAQYFSTHYIATPAESRRRVREVAAFLASAAPGSTTAAR